MSDHWIITFESVHLVLRTEEVLKKHGIDVTIIPIPRHISSDCGIALEVYNKPETIKQFLKEAKITYTGLYQKNTKNDKF